MSNKSTIVIYGTKSMKKNNSIYVNYKDFQNPFYNYEFNIDPINELKKLQRTQIDGSPVADLFAYEGVSLWWFFYPNFSYKFMEVIAFIKNFERFIEEVDPKIIKISDDFRNFEIIKQICEQKKIPLEFSNLNYSKFNLKKKVKFRIRQKSSKSKISKKINQRISLFNKKKSSIPDVNNAILFTSYPTYRRYNLNPLTGNTEKGEYFIQNLIDLLDKNEKIIGIDLYSYVSSDDTALEERLELTMPWFPIEILFKKIIYTEKHNNFLKKYKKIINSKKFEKIFEFKNISYFNQIFPDFQDMKLEYHLPYWMNLIDSLNEFFSKNKPKAIFLTYETGPTSLAIISASKKFGIKTIGIQHGIIYGHHQQYAHEKFASAENTYGFPLPDKLILFGNYFKDLLIKNGYPPEILIPFCNPVFLNLKKIEIMLQEKKLHEKYGIGNDKKIILFTTNRLQEGYELTKKHNYDSQVWKHLLKNFANDDRFFLILKPHPMEIPSIYEKMNKEFNASNAKIIQGSLLELVYLSSIVVSTYSTATMDSLCLKKPVIQVEFNDIKYPIPLGNAVKTSSLKELSNNIIQIIENNSIKNELIANSKKFIKEHYNIPIEEADILLKELLK